MAADFDKPSTTSTKADFPAEIRDNIEVLAKLDPSLGSNVPEGAVRLNQTTKRFEKLASSVWSALIDVWEIKVRNSDQLDGVAASGYVAIAGTQAVTGLKNFNGGATAATLRVNGTAAVWDEKFTAASSASIGTLAGLYHSTGAFAGTLLRTQAENSTTGAWKHHEARITGGVVVYSLYGNGSIVTLGDISTSGTVRTDTIAEKTSAAGVTVDGVLLKDGGATYTSTVTAQKIRHMPSGAITAAATVDLRTRTGMVVEIDDSAEISSMPLDDGDFCIVMVTGDCKLVNGANLDLGGADLYAKAGDALQFAGNASNRARLVGFSPKRFVAVWSNISGSTAVSVTGWPSGLYRLYGYNALIGSFSTLVYIPGVASDTTHLPSLIQLDSADVLLRLHGQYDYTGPSLKFFAEYLTVSTGVTNSYTMTITEVARLM